jgi:hypothetical protein
VAAGRETDDLRALVVSAEGGDAGAAAALAADAPALARLRQTDPALGFRAALVALAHVLAHPTTYPDETARERYSALLDEFGRDPDHMARLKPLGEQLHALEREGVLPRSMVVRSRRRKE